MSLKCSLLKSLIKGKKSWIYILEAINGVQIVHKLLVFCDAFIFGCVIPKNNVFRQDVFNSFLYVIKPFDGSFFKENLITLFIKTWYEKGVKIISSSLDMDENLLSDDIFPQKLYMNVCIMQYHSVITAILKYLKSFLT